MKMKRTKILLCVLMIICMCSCNTGHQIHIPDKNEDFLVEILKNGKWKEIPVHNAKVSDYVGNPEAGYQQYNMGFAMFTLDTPITKTSSSILCLTKDAVAERETSACINCGRCVDACPSRLIPSRLADLAERHNEEAFTKMEGMECMECGSCSYVCPAKRPLKQSIGSMRKIALANRRKK